MLKSIKSIIDKISGSFDTVTNNSFSARKLTAFWFVILTTYLEVKFCENSTLIELVVVNLMLILILLGIITFEQIIKFKEGNTSNEKDVDSGNNNNDSPSLNDSSGKDTPQ